MVYDHDLSSPELEAKIQWVEHHRVAPPVGLRTDEYQARLATLLPNAPTLGERLLTIAGLIDAHEDTLQGIVPLIKEQKDKPFVVKVDLVDPLTGDVHRQQTELTELIARHEARLTNLEIRMIPQIPVTTGIQWSNLWRMLSFIPGTAQPRILLTLWEIGLWVHPSIGTLLGYFFGHWGGAVLGFAGGGLLSFMIHELFFLAYGGRVAKLPLHEEGAPFGVLSSFTAPLERWGGPTV